MKTTTTTKKIGSNESKKKNLTKRHREQKEQSKSNNFFFFFLCGFLFICFFCFFYQELNSFFFSFFFFSPPSTKFFNFRLINQKRQVSQLISFNTIGLRINLINWSKGFERKEGNKIMKKRWSSDGINETKMKIPKAIKPQLSFTPCPFSSLFLCCC